MTNKLSAFDVVNNYVKNGEVVVALDQAIEGNSVTDTTIASASALNSATSLIKNIPGVGVGIAGADLINTFRDSEATTLEKITSVTGALAAGSVLVGAGAPIAVALGLAALGLGLYGMIAGDDEQLSGAINDMFAELGKVSDSINYAFDNPALFPELFAELAGLQNDLNNIVIEGTDESDRPLNGTSRKDVIYGKDGDDLILGGQSNDVLYGQAGNDELYGGFGDDTLVGGVGSDELYGGAGNDFLIGGRTGGVDDNTSDLLKGGAGFDTNKWGQCRL